MCGIAGMATPGQEPPRERIRAMCEAILHRGPDGEGLFTAPGVGLGMRRLAIIDLVTGDQPVRNASGSVSAVFNGEIYNYRELRAELLAKGYPLRGQGDSEVIPHLYDEYGLGFISRLNGMFAIALWDAKEQRLLLTRDRVGIKPLLYSVRHGNLYFASELKSILAVDGSARRIDLRGLDQLLTFEYTASPTTLLDDVHKLPPGGWLTWRRGELETGRYWALPGAEDLLQGTEEAIAEQLRATLTEAVRRQLASDVPLGAFLSGGIDSSILVSAMSEVSASPPQTFSVGFQDASYSELGYARQVAEHCRTQHREELLTADYLSVLPQVISQMDQPIADFSVFPTLLVSRMARSHVTVALGGDGGDELFGGYDAYVADRYSRLLLDWLPDSVRRVADAAVRSLPMGRGKRGVVNQLRRFVEGGVLPSQWQHLRWMIFLSQSQRFRLYRPHFREAVAGLTAATVAGALDEVSAERAGNQMRSDLRLYLPEDILPKVDAMSMAVSLEARVPYLDNEVIDLALRIPASLKIRDGTRKHILRKAFAGRLPPDILARGKEGFSMPMKNWLNNEWNGLMHEVLEDASFARHGLFEPAEVARLMREHETHAENHSHLLWALMVFQLWSTRFLAQPTAASSH
jgi:asparagine synthase (glutamine-hydrolysing)